MWVKSFNGLRIVLKPFLLVAGSASLIMMIILLKWMKNLQASKSNAWKIAILIKIKTLISGYPAIYSRWIIAQAKGESAFYTSKVSQGNNIFGMRCSTKRKKYYTDCINNYAVYTSVYRSISDYFNLMRYNGLPKDFKSLDQFVRWLKQSGYYEASIEQYESMIKSHLT